MPPNIPHISNITTKGNIKGGEVKPQPIPVSVSYLYFSEHVKMLWRIQSKLYTKSVTMKIHKNSQLVESFYEI